jgi:hypothetical protein
MTNGDITKNFSRVNVGEKEQTDIDFIARKIRDLAEYMNQYLPNGRLKSIAFTKLEECAMFSTKSISHK